MESEMKKTMVTCSVGKRVGVRLGGRVLAAVVIEDRGDLGPGGARLVRVEVKPKKGDVGRAPEQFEVPVGALVLAPT